MLGLRPVTRDLRNISFDCGNPSIQNQIKDSYLASLLREGYAYEIIFQKGSIQEPVVLGYCMIKVVTLQEAQLPEDEVDCYSEVYAGRPRESSAVEITYLAVDQTFQGRHIGSFALKLLMGQIITISQRIPIRYIVVNALKEKVPFYLKFGFQTLGHAAEKSATEFLYFDCLVDRQALDEYLELWLN